MSYPAPVSEWLRLALEPSVVKRAFRTMAVVVIECLCCGRPRDVLSVSGHVDDAGLCPRCGYVGWAYSSERSEHARKLFRDLPLERRLEIRPV